MRTLIKLALAVGLAALTSGCAQYKILEFSDHANAETKLNQLQVLKVTNMFVWAQVEHQFWLCTDKGDELECTRSCGGDLDIQCPMGVGDGRVMSTNTR